jgi:hypothetical protein
MSKTTKRIKRGFKILKSKTSGLRALAFRIGRQAAAHDSFFDSNVGFGGNSDIVGGMGGGFESPARRRSPRRKSRTVIKYVYRTRPRRRYYYR